MATERDIRDLVTQVVDGLTAPAAAAPVQDPGPSPGAPGTADIAIGADHGGYALKERLAFKLKQAGHTVHDCGTHTNEPVVYPDYAPTVARLVADGTCGAGILADCAGIRSP